MEFKHTPVLLQECIDNLNIKEDGIYVDGTIGGGGHSLEICNRLGNTGTLIGIDRDKDALKASRKRLENQNCKTIFIQSDFADIKHVLKELKIEKIDGALLDIGVSSFQLDNPDRGFSYMNDAPLDMRMNAENGITAYDVVNSYSKEDLTNLIRNYGEERWAKRIADFIAKDREIKPINTTLELTEIIKKAIPAKARRKGHHPAKKTFQAIRIEVNDELGQISKSVDEYIDVLNSHGRLCIITFHSLEDRIVKEKIQKRLNPCTCPAEFPVCICGKKTDIKKITRKPLIASEKEVGLNPRARSAKLRVCEKL